MSLAVILVAILIVLLMLLLAMLFPPMMQAGLEGAESLWTAGMNLVQSFLLGDPTSFTGTMYAGTANKYAVALGIANNTVKVIAIALVACFAFAELGKSMTTMLEMKRIENVVKALLRICLAWFFVDNFSSCLTIIYNDIFRALANQIASGRTLGVLDNTFATYVTGSTTDLATQFSNSWSGTIDVNTVYNTIHNAANTGSFFDGMSGNMFGLLGSILWIIIGAIMILVLLVSVVSTLMDILITLGQRFLRIWVHVVLAPLAISTFTCSEVSFVGKQFAKSFIGIAMETVIGVVVLILFPGVVNLVMGVWGSNTVLNPTLTLGGGTQQFMGQCIWGSIGLTCCFGILKQLMKSIDQYASQMLGLGGA